MYLDGRSIIDKGIVELGDPAFVDTEAQIQPNGIDLRINKLYRAEGTVTVPMSGKVQPDLHVYEIEPKEGYWDLAPNQGLYWVDFLETANIKDGFVGDMITRSSLVRSGIDVVNGLWDTGWRGQLGCSLRVWQRARIQWGARICQFICSTSEFNGLRYDGRYQGTTSQTSLITNE